MKATIDIPANGDRCGACQLMRWEENPNGWAWVCLPFSERLTNRYWRTDIGWKRQRSADTSKLLRCDGCREATAAQEVGNG